MPPIVVIPVNRFARAKARLARLLTAEERVSLAIATFTTVAGAARDAGLLTVALTPEPERVRALGLANEVIGESPALHGLNEQLEGVVRHIGDEVLILHADLPLATGAAIERFLEQAGRDIGLVCSCDGGTNAMLLCPPGRFGLAYGPGSCGMHESRAVAAGLQVRRIASPELELDLDTSDDIERFLASEAAGSTPAGQVLQRLRR